MKKKISSAREMRTCVWIKSYIYLRVFVRIRFKFIIPTLPHRHTHHNLIYLHIQFFPIQIHIYIHLSFKIIETTNNNTHQQLSGRTKKSETNVKIFAKECPEKKSERWETNNNNNNKNAKKDIEIIVVVVGVAAVVYTLKSKAKECFEKE